MPDLEFDPNTNTSTVADLTAATRDVALGDWTREDLQPHQRYGPFYRTNVVEWQPSRESPAGRWAGSEKPISKEHANEMYALDHLDRSLPWKLYTFYLVPAESTWVFRSKVKGGTSEQIKLPNSVCLFVLIESEESLP